MTIIVGALTASLTTSLVFLLNKGAEGVKKVVASPAPVIEFQIETDRSKLDLSPSEWTVPGKTKLPRFEDGCSEIDDWAQSVPGAVALDPAVRVTMTGNSSKPVVIQRVWVKILGRSPMPKESLFLDCPQGGPISAYVANLSLEHPTKTTYQDKDQNPVKQFAYSLNKGEVGVFYAQSFAGQDSSDLVTTWDLVIDYTLGSVTKTLDLNDDLHRHFMTTTKCDTINYEWGMGWEKIGPGYCSSASN